MRNQRNKEPIEDPLKSPRKDGLSDPVDNQAKMTERWVVRQCPYCDEHGYLPNGFRCPHESPEVLAERAHRGAELARAELLRVATAPASQLDRRRPTREPWLPADLAAETQQRSEQPETDPQGATQ